MLFSPQNSGCVSSLRPKKQTERAGSEAKETASLTSDFSFANAEKRKLIPENKASVSGLLRVYLIPVFEIDLYSAIQIKKKNISNDRSVTGSRI